MNRKAAGLIVAGVFAVGLLWRWRRWPCPAWLVPLLENPYFNFIAGAEMLLERAAVAPGMAVLDAGCGPGRLTVPAARRVGQAGRVTALDVQPAMLAMLRRKLAAEQVANVEMIEGGLGEGHLPAAAFDRAFLVTVLGELPDRLAALREIFTALRPGGILSITEALPDPHYQPIGQVRRLGEAAGFEPAYRWNGLVSFTLNLRKPEAGS